MNPQDELEALWGLVDKIIDGIESTIQSGEILSDEFQGQLAQELALTAQRITQLNQVIQQAPTEAGQPTPAMGETPTTPTPGEAAIPTGQPIPQLNEAPFASSNISRFRYDPSSKKLIIQFLGEHPNRNGSVYEYANVPQNIFDVFKRGAVAPKTSGKNAWHTWKEGSTPSLGASAYALIRGGGYPFQRLG